MSEDGDMARLVAWIEAETGLSFPEVHHETIRKAAARRCQELDLEPADFAALLHRDEEEKKLFFAKIVIGETYFFRDERQFAALVLDVLPALLRGRRELRLWSATCATGEEALSMVAAVMEAGARAGIEVDYRVLATDINEEALSRLRAGRFPASSFRNDGKAWHPLLERLGKMDGDEWVASPEVLSRIEARHFNVLSGHLPSGPGFDLVLFRNTLVYMQPDKKERALSRVAAAIRPGGYLFLASPEVPTVRHPLLETLESGGAFFFRRLEKEAQAHRHRAHVHGEQPEPRSGAPAPKAGAAQARGLPTEKPSAKPERTRHERPPSERHAFRPEDLESGLALASLWLREPDNRPRPGKQRPTMNDGAPGRDAPAGDAPASDAARKVATAVEEILGALCSGEHDKASGLLDAFEAGGRENPIGQYLRGLSMKMRDRLPEAVEYWERARTYDRRFWPALFQAGMALDASDPARADLLLRECLAAMEGQADPRAYAVLLDGFNSEYYRRMAERLLARARRR